MLGMCNPKNWAGTKHWASKSHWCALASSQKISVSKTVIAFPSFQFIFQFFQPFSQQKVTKARSSALPVHVVLSTFVFAEDWALTNKDWSNSSLMQALKLLKWIKSDLLGFTFGS